MPQPGHQTPKLSRDPTPWFFLGTPSVPHTHPAPSRTRSPARRAGVHHHMDLQPAVQEVQGGVLGTQECQGQPQTGTGVWGEGLGSWDGDEGGSD